MIGIQRALLSVLVALIPEAIAASPYCKGGVPAIIASGLAIYQPAVTYCSRSFPVPAITSTRTAATTTITTVVGTVTSLTTVATSTNTVVAPAVFSTVTAATDIVSQSTTVGTTTFTFNSAVTSTSTSTVFSISIIQKRDAATEIEKRIPQATTTKNSAASSALGSVQKSASPYIQSVCDCLENPVTTYVTSTPSATASVTATVYSSVTDIILTTVTPTSLVPVTDLTTLTVPITNVATITVTNTVATVATATQIVQYRGPVCNQPSSFGGVGGCSSNCYCDPRAPGGQAYGLCDTALGCTQAACSSDFDCNAGESCADYGCSQGPVCVNYQGCTSSFVPDANAKRGLEGFERVARLKQRQSVNETAADLLTCRQQGIEPDECLL